ncbi:MAG TPA: PIN domain-containing protein [Anaerolineae bacterium]|nr:PIN domain-containing protein [Anaerolineae bacterium]
MAVVDASVILAAVRTDDPHHEASKAWLDAIIAAESYFSAPVLLLGEVAAPLSRGYRQPERGKRMARRLQTASFVKLVPVTLSLASRAAVIAADYRIRGCDAVYVALAEALGEELITLDRQQRERALDIISARQP